MKTIFSFAIIMVSLLLGCSPKTSQVVDMEVVATIINENNAKYENFYNTGDAAGVASLHTEDAVVMPPNLDFCIGKEAIEKAIDAEIQMGAGGLKFTQLELVVKNDTAYEIGKYYLNVTVDGEVITEDNGKFIVIWEKQEDGNWLMKKDIWNTNLPLATN